jgi:hypothetical protein
VKSRTRNGLLLGGGFLLGTLGLKALTSEAAKKCYVQGIAQGMRAKSAYETMVEQAKAQVDDMMAEATYINVAAAEEKAARTDAVEVEAVDVASQQK